MTVVLGVDSGGSGLRAALGVADGARRPAPRSSREPVRTGPRGIDAAHLVAQLEPMARELLAEAGDGARLTAVAVGAAGMASLGDELRDRLPAALAELFGVRRVALAADAVTAYAGALGQRPGAVVAAGTGLIATGTDLTAWRRADGWGHLLGDCGGGAWIGRAGLEAALRSFDGRRGGSAALRARAEARFGAPLSGLPGLLYPRPDRPAVLASFAPEVGRCAAEGDPVALGVLHAAAGHIADAAAAACPASGDCELALTGGLLKLGDVLLVPLEAELTERLPHARRVPAAGDPLDGAVRIATDLAQDTLKLPHDPQLLRVTTLT
ncbi:N-acetylglucosamine kinase [Streptomyces sp. AN091965]|uniref:N-acetylglucosamine kinase n=1 Tax=Streptomyces sp. AN091965 TaxID=2927803 RepID=UPI001F621032|nr:BadF/BadG/BcrA/BcrD ATPase family protein [Streptomyces sp. AN091965]MCI3934812.1 ATPase [Streptomyces sp. AN091965]